MAKIITTIKALLAKAAGTNNPHEAEIFLAKAHELMEKHQLCAADLETDDPLGNERTYRRADRGGVDWDFMLLFPVAKYFGCKCIRMNTYQDGKYYYEMDMVGRDSARVTAIEMHKYLVATVRRLGREAAANRTMKLYKDCGDGRMRWTGDYLNVDQCTRRIGNALRERIAQLNAQNRPKTPDTPAGKNALITLNGVNALYKKLHPDASAIKGSYSTNNAGREIAAGIGLNLQTGGRSTLALK